MDPFGARAVAPEDPDYPRGLERLPGSHPVVFLRGGWDRRGWRVAVVGSRRASPEGALIAFELAVALAAEGVEILSGLAVGIDAAAHRGALSVSGRTGAVLGTGFDRCYPPEHAALQEEVAASVGLLTERPPGSPVTPGAFASRNRLLAALSDAVVLVEGNARSGARITARHARSIGCPVGAVPWSVWNPQGAAPHALLRSGDATLVTGPKDVLALLGGEARPGATRAWAGAAPSRAGRAPAPGSLEARVMRALRERPRSLDEVAAEAAATVPEASAALLLLEMAGSVRREFGGRVRLVPNLRFTPQGRS
jgi:DNA processing protein